MSVVGLDVGNDTSCVALARKRGVDVLMNKESKRETPAVISFGGWWHTRRGGVRLWGAEREEAGVDAPTWGGLMDGGGGAAAGQAGKRQQRLWALCTIRRSWVPEVAGLGTDFAGRRRPLHARRLRRGQGARGMRTGHAVGVAVSTVHQGCRVKLKKTLVTL